MTSDHPVRTYGGWRRSRSIGLLGLGPTPTFVLLGCFAALIVLTSVSLRLLLYAGPPAVLTGAAGVVRVNGVPLAQLAVQRLRWWHGKHVGYISYRADVVQQHAGVLQLPGTLAATELLSAEDGRGGRYGLVRDRHTGYLTATIRVAPVSTWLADPADADQWVANWDAWLASLGYLPALRWVTVTVDTAPDPGSTLTQRMATAIDPAAPRPALEIMDQIVAAAPAAAADVDTRISITIDPAAFPAQPRARSPRRSPRPARRCSAWNPRSAPAGSASWAGCGPLTWPRPSGSRSTRRCAATSAACWPRQQAPRWKPTWTGPPPARPVRRSTGTVTSTTAARR